MTTSQVSILRHAKPIAITHGHVVVAMPRAQLRRTPVPFEGGRRVGRHTSTVGIHASQVVRSYTVPLQRCPFIPDGGLFFGFENAFSLFEHPRQLELGLCIAL